MTQFRNLLSLSEEIETLDEPYFQPVHAGNFSNGSKLLGTKRFRAVVSERNGILSVVSNRYSIVQSKDVLRSVVTALRSLGIHDVSGTIDEQNGRTFARILLPKYVSEKSQQKVGDDIQLGFLLINSYDASRSLTLQGYAMRLVCSNGMVAPRTLGQALVRKHVGDVNLKVEDAVREIVNSIIERSPYLTELIEKASEQFYESFDAMTDELKGIGFSEKTAEKILLRLERADRYSKWHLYNAITSFYTRKKMKENGRVSMLAKAEKLLC